MTGVVLVGGESNTASNVIQSFYSAPISGSGVTITAWAAVNDSAANASYKAYIYDDSGSILSAVVPTKIVVRNKFDVGPSITNQFIPAGGSLRMESSAAGSIDFRVSGVFVE